MPKSKRATVVHLTKTSKKTKERKGNLVDELRQAVDTFKYVWVFEIEHMRNVYMQEIRAKWQPGRIFLGRNAVMRVALGSTPEDEHRPGLHKLSALLEGDTGLLFTDESPKIVIEWFDSFVKPDYARKGNTATETVILPGGPVMIRDPYSIDEPTVAPHSLEPHLRSLTIPTTLLKGVPTLSAPHEVCKQGQTLDTKQCGALKALGWMMAGFKVKLGWCWERDGGGEVKAVNAVREAEGMEVMME